jgi:hypothetical protein
MKTEVTTVTCGDMELLHSYSMGISINPANFPLSWRYSGRQYKGLPGNIKIAKRFLDANGWPAQWKFEIDGSRIFAEGLRFTQPVRSGAILFYSV